MKKPTNKEKRVFAQRLEEIMKKRGKNQKDLSADVGVSPQTISYYVNDERLPDAEILCKIAQNLNVSADYLIGASNAPTPDIDLQAIHSKTGLSDKVISSLMYEMRILYGFTNRSTPSDAIETVEQYKSYIELKERSDKEKYAYAEKLGIIERFEDDGTSLPLFFLEHASPTCNVINALFDADDDSSLSIMEALHDLFRYKPTTGVYEIAEFVDKVDPETGQYVDWRIPGELNDGFLYSSDIFALKLLKLQQAFTLWANKHGGGKQ